MPLKRTTFFFTLIDVLPERRTFFPREERSLREKNVLYARRTFFTREERSLLYKYMAYIIVYTVPEE